MSEVEAHFAFLSLLFSVLRSLKNVCFLLLCFLGNNEGFSRKTIQGEHASRREWPVIYIHPSLSTTGRLQQGWPFTACASSAYCMALLMCFRLECSMRYSALSNSDPTAVNIRACQM